MKTLLSAMLLLSLFCSAPPAHASSGYYRAGEAPAAKTEDPAHGQGGTTLVITPVEECYAEFAPEEAEKIKQGYAKPYRECLRRLGEKQKQTLEMSAPEASKDAAAPETKH